MFLLYFIIFILGLIIGSFLNVVIFRLENKEKIINDRSKCLHCGHILKWYDLIPVLSFIFLKGKCRYCNNKISWQYPLVEIGTGVLFIMIMNYELRIMNYEYLISNIQYSILSLLFWFYITSVFIVIFVYDLKHYIIPDKVIYPAIIITFIYKLFEILKFGHWDLFGIWNLPAQCWSASGGEFGILDPVLYLLFPAFAASIFFYSIVIITKGKGMGGGDIKLAFLMGLILGWPTILLSLFLSFIFGSIVGIFLILIGKKKMGSMIPFGPFLIVGTFIGLFLGERLINWYLSIIIY
jgi:prepilin signal peptidase PulO-like enzyme (type II secretory pathway)